MFSMLVKSDIFLLNTSLAMTILILISPVQYFEVLNNNQNINFMDTPTVVPTSNSGVGTSGRQEFLGSEFNSEKLLQFSIVFPLSHDFICHLFI